MAVIAFITANKVAIVLCLLGISEGLALIPSVKANSIFQAIVNGLKALKAKFGA